MCHDLTDAGSTVATSGHSHFLQERRVDRVSARLPELVDRGTLSAFSGAPFSPPESS
jgi:hypothetical protein